MDDLERLQRKAQKYLQSAAVLLELEDFDSCVSRAYFAMFYAMCAAMAGEGLNIGSPRGARTVFLQHFIRRGLLPERAGRALLHAAEYQELADYSTTFAIDREVAESTLQEAEAFINSLARFVPQPA